MFNLEHILNFPQNIAHPCSNTSVWFPMMKHTFSQSSVFYVPNRAAVWPPWRDCAVILALALLRRAALLRSHHPELDTNGHRRTDRRTWKLQNSASGSKPTEQTAARWSAKSRCDAAAVSGDSVGRDTESESRQA